MIKAMNILEMVRGFAEVVGIGLLLGAALLFVLVILSANDDDER